MIARMHARGMVVFVVVTTACKKPLSVEEKIWTVSALCSAELPIHHSIERYEEQHFERPKHTKTIVGHGSAKESTHCPDGQCGWNAETMSQD